MLKLERPVFINGFSRGGTSLLWNIIGSHPNFIMPDGETHQILLDGFYKKRFIKGLKYDFFSRNFIPKPHLTRKHLFVNYGTLNPANFSKRNLHCRLYEEVDNKIAHNALNNARHEEASYSKKRPDETEQRIVCKNINGIIFLTPTFQKMYQDSMHIGLIRNGLALLESRARRNTMPNPETFASIFKIIGEQMLEYRERYDNFHLYKFEDLTQSPSDFIARIYQIIDAPPSDDQEYLLKVKSHYNETGDYISPRIEGEKTWFDRERLSDFISPKINENQLKKLPPSYYDRFMLIAGRTMEKLGYA